MDSNIHLETTSKQMLELPSKKTQSPGEAEARIQECESSLSCIVRVCFRKRGRSGGGDDNVFPMLMNRKKESKDFDIFPREKSWIR